ncbi:MAG TPA: putative sulfate exporter family transporter [Vicinamibacterales bacterium]|nr:putative sulfate exporter family transporter [Vicinamibacterales bacterium]
MSLMVAAAAAFLASQYDTPVLLIALLLGMSAAFLAENPASRPGIEFAAGPVLRCGVALLGLRVAFGDLVALGGFTVTVLAVAASITIGGGILLAKVLKLDKSFGALSGGAVAICGVSAAIAISSVMPRSKAMDQHLAVTIVTVTVFGSLAMVFYPALVQFAGFDTLTAAVFLGASIHDVSHVVGAGYSVSPEVGDLAVLTKMIRVVMLVPVVWGFFWVYHSRATAASGGGKWPLPWFLILFVALAVIASFEIVPNAILRAADGASRWLLVVAIAALGMKTSLRALLATGWRPVLLVFGESTLLGALVLAWTGGFL